MAASNVPAVNQSGMHQRRVVVTGMGVVSCLGNDHASVAASLRDSRSGISFIPEYAEMGLYFTIRHRTDVSPVHHIIYESKTYEIIGQPREIGRRRWLKMQARLVE